MMKKYKVHALPTEKAEGCQLFRTQKGKYSSGEPKWTYAEAHQPPLYGIRELGWKAHHLYFTSDEEIKEGDAPLWCINTNGDTLYQLKSIKQEDKNHWRKVIATNNRDLWYKNPRQAMGKPDMVNRIDKDFIEAFVREQGIWEVMLEMEMIDMSLSLSPNHVSMEPTGKLKLNSQGAVIIHKVKEKMYTRDEFFEGLVFYGEQIFSNLDKFGKMTKLQVKEWFNKHY